MKNTIKLSVIIAFIAVIGFSFVACDTLFGTSDGKTKKKTVVNKPDTNKPDDSKPDDSKPVVPPVPAPIGGKTSYYRSEHKIVFDSSTGPSGSYTMYMVKVDKDSDEYYILDANDKYTWESSETGTYTWNDDAKTVTLKPARRAFTAEQRKILNAESGLKTRAEWKTVYSNFLNSQYTQEQITELLTETGYSSLEEFIDAEVSEYFDDHSHHCSFSTDVLFMQQAVPQPKGTDELAGQTYSENYGSYVFNGANKTYTYTRTGYPAGNKTGFYSYDSTSTPKKVYLSQLTIGGKTIAEYYEELIEQNRTIAESLGQTIEEYYNYDDHYDNVFVEIAVQATFNYYRYNDYHYKPTEKLIGFFDDDD